MSKRNNCDKIPRHRRMTRERRLQSAASTNFLEAHQAKDAIRHYARWYGVDLLCAVTELRVLGMTISPECEECLKKSRKGRIEQKRMKQEKNIFPAEPDSDEIFAYIAGYTAWGLPYGTTWKELEKFAEAGKRLNRRPGVEA